MDNDLSLCLGSLIDFYGVDAVLRILWECLNDRELFDVSTIVFDALLEQRVSS